MKFEFATTYDVVLQELFCEVLIAISDLEASGAVMDTKILRLCGFPRKRVEDAQWTEKHQSKREGSNF